MIKRRLCIYDFETNGFWNPTNQPIQVAIKIVELDGTEINYSNFIKCPTPINAMIQSITGITDSILSKMGIPIEEAFKAIDDLMNVPETLIIGHNILTFDNMFLNHYLQKFGYQPIDKTFCFDTYGHFKGHLLQKRRSEVDTFAAYHGRMIAAKGKGLVCKLPNACDYYGVKKIANFHNAKADIDYTYGIYLEQVKDYDNKLPLNVNRLSRENKLALGIPIELDKGLFA